MSPTNTAMKERDQWRARIDRALAEFRASDALVVGTPPRDDDELPPTRREGAGMWGR